MLKGAQDHLSEDSWASHGPMEQNKKRKEQDILYMG